jgi:hypothetical protein
MKQRAKLLVATLLVLTHSPIFAQSPYSLDEVANMLKAEGAGAIRRDDVRALLRKNGVDFRLTVANVLALQRSGLSDSDLALIEELTQSGASTSNPVTSQPTDGGLSVANADENGPGVSGPDGNTSNGNGGATPADKGKSMWPYVSLWGGAKLENPYSITVDRTNHTAILQSDDSTTDGYLELRLRYRFVDRIAAYADEPKIYTVKGRSQDVTPKSGFFGQWDYYPLPDIDTSIGYVFRDSSSPTNFNSSTIVGGSDLYVSGSLGFPYWRYIGTSGGGMRAIQATLEVSGGFVTDRNILLLHPHIFAGGGFQFLYFRGNQNDPLPGFWTGRIGYARVDEPRLIGDKNVALNGRDEPLFDAEWVPSLGFDVSFPISKTLSAQFGGNAFFTDSPSSWNLNLGLLVNVDKLFQ